MNKKKCWIKSLKLWWITTIWPKWQIVIPKDIREKMNMNPWDSVVLIYSDTDKHVSIVRNDDMNKIFEFAKNEWITIE